MRRARCVPGAQSGRRAVFYPAPGQEFGRGCPSSPPPPMLGGEVTRLRPPAEGGSLGASYARGAAARSQPCGRAHALPPRLYLRTGETPSSPPRAGGNEIWPGFCQHSDRQFLTYSRRGRDTNTLGSYLHPGVPWAGRPVSPQGALYF